MSKFKLLTKNNLLTTIGILTGGVAGFLYWRFVGCSSGSCPITSSPVMSSIWGATIGGLLLSIFRTDKKQKNNTQT
ncbi:MAG: hypothetical protein HXK55_04835 [Bacteroidetes bacterium]|nr:hypothetical protein [Bacteroidota bacterium]